MPKKDSSKSKITPYGRVCSKTESVFALRESQLRLFTQKYVDAAFDSIAASKSAARCRRLHTIFCDVLAFAVSPLLTTAPDDMKSLLGFSPLALYHFLWILVGISGLFCLATGMAMLFCPRFKPSPGKSSKQIVCDAMEDARLQFDNHPTKLSDL